MPTLTHARVEEVLLSVWGQQSCCRPADWPAVLKALVAPDTGSRTSYRWRVDNAVAVLTEAFGSGLLPDDPAGFVWRAFPHLDRHGCRVLAQQLAEASGAQPVQVIRTLPSAKPQPRGDAYRTSATTGDRPNE
jgi:hypothetical protein